MLSPQCVVIAGPNGAGKSSAAPGLLRDTVGVGAFVNADVIAQGLAGFAPQAVALEAGRIMLQRLDALILAGGNFAFETTLSGKTVERLIRRALDAGYEVHVYYLWLASSDVAVARVRQRVALGGHDVPEAVIRRRYRRSLANRASYRSGGVTSGRWYDGGAIGSPRLIGNGGKGRQTEVADPVTWKQVEMTLREAT